MSDDRRFAFIPKRTTHSKDLNALPVSARWLYTVMVAERGGLKEPFEFSYTDIKKITGFARTTIRRAVKDLDAAGFLDYEHGGLECNPNIYELDDNRLQL